MELKLVWWWLWLESSWPVSLPRILPLVVAAIFWAPTEPLLFLALQATPPAVPLFLSFYMSLIFLSYFFCKYLSKIWFSSSNEEMLPEIPPPASTPISPEAVAWCGFAVDVRFDYCAEIGISLVDICLCCLSGEDECVFVFFCWSVSCLTRRFCKFLFVLLAAVGSKFGIDLRPLFAFRWCCWWPPLLSVVWWPLWACIWLLPFEVRGLALKLDSVAIWC